MMNRQKIAVMVDSGTDVPAAFQNDGILSRHGQHKGGEQPRRAAPDHNRPDVGRGLPPDREDIGRGNRYIPQSPRKNALLRGRVSEFTFHGADEMHVVLFARVDRFFDKSDFTQLGGGNF